MIDAVDEESERTGARFLRQEAILILSIFIDDCRVLICSLFRLSSWYPCILILQDSSLEFMLPSESSDSLSRMDEFDFDSALIIFTDTKSLELPNKFCKDADAYYVEAKWGTVSSVTQIPYWIYGVLVVLGWNEAMAVLFSPYYFTFLLIVLAALLVFYSWISIIFLTNFIVISLHNLEWLDCCYGFCTVLQGRCVDVDFPLF